MSRSLPAPGDVVRIRGARWRVTHHTAYKEATLVGVCGCDRDNQGERALFLLPFEHVERLPPLVHPRLVSPPAWRRCARSILAGASPAYGALDSAVAADFDLLPFQLEPALAVTRGLGSRLLVADDVGLGKTVQASLVIAEVVRRCPGEGRALVVCPASLREQWQLELGQRFQLEATVMDAAALAGPAPAAHAPNPWAAHPIVITSIDYVKRPEVMRALEPLVWDVGVFDEAHTLAGRSDRRTAAEALADRSRVVVLLTATPHSGDDDAFARLCAIGSLQGEHPLLAFRRTRADAGVAVARRSRWLRVRPTGAEGRMHAALSTYARRVGSEKGRTSAGARLAMAVLTRRACSSAVSLARSLARRILLLATPAATVDQPFLPLGSGTGDDEEPAAELASPGLADPGVERRMLEELTRLARAAAADESKLRRLRRLLDTIGEPALVFTEYRDTLEHLESSLGELSPALLHGGLAASERRDVIRQFTSGATQVLLATDAASEGLNLHHRCRLVINLELPWTPIRLEQRIGRVERIGQKRRVHAIQFVAAGTAEDTTAAVLCGRMERASRVLGAIGRPDADATAILDSFLGVSAPPSTLAERGGPGESVAGDDLRALAQAEAERIAGRRRMRTPGVAPGRPAAAVIRRRTRPPAGYWAFRTLFVDAGQRHVWESARAFEVRLLRPPGGSARTLAEWFTARWEGFAPLLQAREALDQAELEAAMADFVANALRRERSIAGAPARRMAAALVQPGLFDSRSERAAAAQAAIVEEAVRRCTERLAGLDAMRHVRVSRRDLLFAVVLS